MGIKNLWQLLSPVGRSVSIETLSGKTLAVDVSIWLTQFIKAMRDDDGKVVKNAHIIGTLRRVIKLLFHRIRPVFVFDGGAPALKGRTLAARRKLRTEGTDASLRKTAQRILASQLKKHKVALRAAKRTSNKAAEVASFNPVYQSAFADDGSTKSEGGSGCGADGGGHKSDSRIDDADSDQPGSQGAVAALDPSETTSWETRSGGQRVTRSSSATGSSEADATHRASGEGIIGEADSDDDDDVDWEDAAGAESEATDVPAAGHGATGHDLGNKGASSVGEGGGGDDEDAPWAVDTDEDEEEKDGGWEEVDLPDQDEDIDPEVIASLPGHVKKQVIEAAKRRQRMRSRSQYMPVAGDPALYSQTQLSNFLRSQKLNSQIMKAHKQDDGEREGKRIASEAGRRYIMIPAGSTGAAIGRGNGSQAATAAANGSERGGSAPGPAAGTANGRRHRRIADEGDEFEAWTYEANSPDSRPIPGQRTEASSVAGRPAAAGQGSDKGGQHERGLDEDEGEGDAAGFLPEDTERASDQGNAQKGDRDDDGEGSEEGGGFLASDDDAPRLAISAPPQDPAGALPSAAKKGKGKGKASTGEGKRRLERLAQAAGASDEGNDEDDVVGAPSPRAAAAGGKYDSSDAGAEAIAKAYQEEEDRRSAAALQNGNESRDAREEELGSVTVDDSGGRRRGDDTASSDTAVDGANIEEASASGSSRCGRGTQTRNKPVSDNAAVKALTLGPGLAISAGRGVSEPGGDKHRREFGLEEENDGSGAIELEIDPGNVNADAERAAFLGLLRSDARSAGWTAPDPSDGDGEGDSDEEFDGFVDDDGGAGGERQRASSQASGSAASVTNDVALRRSIDMASRMAGWAGRVVERVLKEHRQTGPSSAPAVVHARSGPSAAGSSSRPGEARSGRAVPTALPVVFDRAPQALGRQRAAQADDGGAGRRLDAAEKDASRRTPGGKHGESRESKDNRGQSVDKPLDVTDGGNGDAEDFGSESELVEEVATQIPPSKNASVTRSTKTGRSSKARASPEVTNGVQSASEGRPSESSGATLQGSLEGESDSDEGTRRTVAGGASMAETRASATTAGANRTGPAEGSPANIASPAASGDELPPVTDGARPLKRAPVDAQARVEAQEQAPPHEVSLVAQGAAAMAPDGVDEQSDLGSETNCARARATIPVWKTGAEADGAADDVESSLLADHPEPMSDASGTEAHRDPDEGAESSLFLPSAEDGATAMAEAAAGVLGQQPGAERTSNLSRLMDMDEDELGEESERLKQDSNRAQRDAETVTDEMKEEVMDLLQLFGVPFVIAPMEAEAQCCELERLRLVDGTVTDDSDAFAFGGRTVYKNIFNERKYVEAYLLPDLEKDLGVGTDEVVALALLLGSDYTEGVKGVGIVNAMEIINAFPMEGKGPEHGLAKFKKWIDGFDPVLDAELEGLVKHGTKAELARLSPEMTFHLKHRTARNRWTVSEGFPSKEVINAYKNPQVDKSEERFSWATPDIDGLRALCQRVLGWDRLQADGLLMPMVKELDRSVFSQQRIDRYFMTYHDNRRVAAIKSKRLRSAVVDLANGATEVVTVEADQVHRGGKRAKTSKTTPASETEHTDTSVERPKVLSHSTSAEPEPGVDTVEPRLDISSPERNSSDEAEAASDRSLRTSTRTATTANSRKRSRSAVTAELAVASEPISRRRSSSRRKSSTSARPGADASQTRAGEDSSSEVSAPIRGRRRSTRTSTVLAKIGIGSGLEGSADDSKEDEASAEDGTQGYVAPRKGETSSDSEGVARSVAKKRSRKRRGSGTNAKQKSGGSQGGT